jgi:5-formyltetrahydrofolate cyclo-ligase
MEPPRDAPVLKNPSAVIVPGLAFDREGYRLGRGGGYYDRYLIGKTCRKIGLCRPELLVDRLPRDEWDIPVDLVMTGGSYAEKI